MMDIRLRPIHKDLIKSRYHVKSTIRLLSFSLVRNAYERKYHGETDENNIVVWQFIQWNELVNPFNPFIRDGCIKLDFDIELNESVRQSVPSTHRSNESGIGCPICLERYMDIEINRKLTFRISHHFFLHFSLLDITASSLKCGHIFCRQCITNSIKSKKQCPICNARCIASQIRPAFLPQVN